MIHDKGNHDDSNKKNDSDGGKDDKNGQKWRWLFLPAPCADPSPNVVFHFRFSPSYLFDIQGSTTNILSSLSSCGISCINNDLIFKSRASNCHCVSRLVSPSILRSIPTYCFYVLCIYIIQWLIELRACDLWQSALLNVHHPHSALMML